MYDAISLNNHGLQLKTTAKKKKNLSVSVALELLQWK